MPRRTRGGSAGRGPGRPKHTRATVRARTSAPPPVTPEEPAASPVIQRGLRLTKRAAILLVVFALLALSYASSLRIHFTQQHDIAQAEADIRAMRERNAQLESELKRWRDPDHIVAEARHRLGWVMPGDTSWIVLGADGLPLDKGTSLPEREDSAVGQPWWKTMAESIAIADAPGDAGSSRGNPPTPQPSETP